MNRRGGPRRAGSKGGAVREGWFQRKSSECESSECGLRGGSCVYNSQDPEGLDRGFMTGLITVLTEVL